MLGIHKSYNGKAAVKYFKEGLSKESKEGNYYLDENVKAVWDGKAAALLGLHGKQVTLEDFSNLVHNRHPVTGEKITVRNAEDRRAGFDFTFSAPKSVSVLHAITKDPALLEAHRTAYNKAMEQIEASMYTQANSQHERGFQKTGNLIFCAFDHHLSRPCEVQKNGKILHISDPQIHSHLYTPNLTYNAAKSRFQALQEYNVHSNAPYFEAVYHSILSHELNRAGYQTTRTAERYEVAGVSRAIIEKFSNRTKIIEDFAKEKGITDPKAKSELSIKTRHAKANSVSKDKLEGYWKERLTKAELETLHNIKGKAHEIIRPISAKEAIDRSLEHFLERNSVAQEKRVLAHALKLGYGQLLPEDVNRELASRDNILRSEVDSITQITTREMVRAEDNMIELATRGKGKFKPLNPDYKIKQDFLNDQQRKAIKDILTSNDQVSILKGSAGVGKTSLLTEVRDGAFAATKSLYSVAPSSQASKVLRQKGFEANTIAGLLHNPKLQEKLRNNVLLVDEAGMCGVKTMSELLALAKRYNTRVVLSGDIRQHGPPGQYGDALRILQDKAELKTATVQKIMRQKPKDYREAVQKLAGGRTLEGYQALSRMGAIKEIPDHEHRLNKIADDYVDSITKKRTALIVSPTHMEGAMINEIVRKKLRSKGRLQGKDRSFNTLKNLSFTDSQKKDPVNYSEGQVIRYVKNQVGFKAGSHYEVLPSKNHQGISVRDLTSGQVLKLPHDNPEHYQVYQKTKTEIAKGDLIRLTNNSKTLQNTKVNNGTTYRIEGFTKSGDLMLGNGRTLSKDNRYMTHGYAETSHSSQSKDVRDVFVSMSDLSFTATDEKAFYVSVSRGTHSVSIYTSDKADLKNAIIKSGERTTAREVADDHQRQLLQQKQRRHHRTLNEKLKEHGRTQQRQKQPTKGIPKEPGRD